MGPLLRVVLDTNVLISALVYQHGKTATLRHQWQARRFVPICNQHTVAELVQVLAYRKFRLDAHAQQELLTDYLPYAQVHPLDDVSAVQHSIPQCRDPKDQMFLLLAFSAKADVLVTGDDDLLQLQSQIQTQSRLQVERPEAFLQRLALASY